MTVDNEINGSLLKLKRESLGWTLADMAARACLSTKQVRQLEEGGENSFYSHAIKLTTAKKIAQILQISEDELFYRMPIPSVDESSNGEHPAEIDSAHLEPLLSQSPSQPLDKSMERDTDGETSLPAGSVINSPAKAALSSATQKDVDAPVSFASILTRSQSSSDDLDALLAHEESTPGDESHSEHEREHENEHEAEHQNEPSRVVAAPVSTSSSASDLSHHETLGVPSTPSPITLSSASSSLSEDQHTQDQSIWVKVILAILVLIGAVLIVAPKTFDGLAQKIESSFKKTEMPSEPNPNATNTVPLTVPALDASQSDTPVELSKPVSGAQEAPKQAPAVSPSSQAPVAPAAPVAPPSTAQQSNTSIPTTAVPSSNSGLGISPNSANAKPSSSASSNTPTPATPNPNAQ